jgi:glycosyltransferase involved in cell wall biosynthesis
VPAARNTGIEASDGSYIAFLDDDDIWLPAKLERQLEAAAAGADVVHTLVYLADGDGNVYERGSEAGFRLFREVAAAGYPYHWLLRRSSFFINTFLVRRECIEKIGGFDEELPAVDDLDFVHRLRREYEFRLVDEPLVKYCFHGGNQGNRTPHGSWLRLAAKELAWVREHDVPERRAVEAYLHRQCAQSHWIAGDNRRAAASALRARRLDSSVIDTRTVAKYATAALLPKRLTARVRRRVAATRPAGEPWPFIDLG